MQISHWWLWVAAIAAGLGIAGLRLRLRKGAGRRRDQPDASLDIGQVVQVSAWIGRHGRGGQVRYLGAVWPAEAEEGIDVERPLYIRAINGPVLVVGN